VQFFALTRWDKSGIIDHKFIKPAMKKRSICGGFSESYRVVRDNSRKQRRALWSRLSQKRADATSIGQRGWNRGRYLELSSLAEMRGMEAFFYSSLETTNYFDRGLAGSEPPAQVPDSFALQAMLQDSVPRIRR